eukprot:TRINITY_DN203_c0_g1_i2.p1 TRINITY_DN203_c0_g1~~TRINITY_DN203_c0_g1_i2.p1  ORF type:complete len:205 (-),score=22.60 TRINITY_DN203_c0_g1_i2:52-666(-)
MNCNLRGYSQLDISVSKLYNPCEISERTWYVTIFSCDGSLLTHCGRRYIVIPIRCGMGTIRVPPGLYKVSAVWSYFELPDGNYQANHFTDSVLVQACCNSCHCVRLYNPSIHRCGPILMAAAQDTYNQLIAQGVEGIQPAFEALNGAMDQFLAIAQIHNGNNRQFPFEFERGLNFENVLRGRVEMDGAAGDCEDVLTENLLNLD